MPQKKYLFELQVYRLKESYYYTQMNMYIEKTISKRKEQVKKMGLDLTVPQDTKYLKKSYGGDWRYNEIIGFLKFYQYGANQIRIEYWETNSTRKVKTRKKQFEKKTDCYFKMPFSKNDNNSDLANTMLAAVENCENILEKEKRYIDKELFLNTVHHISWQDILK